jgi:hypothetical protein
MDKHEPNPASQKVPAEGSRENVDVRPEKDGKRTRDEFESKTGLPGKTDSGPEPDVFGQEIPPQDD